MKKDSELSVLQAKLPSLEQTAKDCRSELWLKEKHLASKDHKILSKDQEILSLCEQLESEEKTCRDLPE